MIILQQNIILLLIVINLTFIYSFKRSQIAAKTSGRNTEMLFSGTLYNAAIDENQSPVTIHFFKNFR